MKSIILDRNSQFNYLISKPFSCQAETGNVSNFRFDLNIADNFVSDNFELVSTDIKEISNIWQDNNHNIFIYEKLTGGLWKISSSNDSLTLLNSNFTSIINNLYDISDQVSATKLKYSTYNNCFYISCQPNNDNSNRLKVLTVTGSTYNTINQGTAIEGWFSRDSSSTYEFTYDGPYCVVAESYINNFNSNSGYDPKFVLHISNNNRSSWSDVTKQAYNKSEFGANVSVSSYNGTYYIYDYRGWYFNQNLPTVVITTNPNTLTNIITSDKLSSSSSVTFRREGNYIVGSDFNFTTDFTTFVKNDTSVYQLSPSSGKFYSRLGSDQASPYTYDYYDFTENTIGADLKIAADRKCYAERGSRPFTLYKSDNFLSEQCTFFTNNYIYQLNSKGLVRCHPNDLVTRI